jgi:phospholipid/cholesterol/gamma-HCH transport system substrate-binding protein
MIAKAIGMIDKAIAMGRLRELSKQTSHTLLGGAVMLIGIIALVLSQGAALTKDGDGYELTARYGSIAGVGLGTKVLLTGIQVGEVVRRKYEPGQQRAVIVMNMRGDVEIPLDTVAMIVSDGLMGNKYIKLQPGGEVEMMRDGDEFEYVQDSIIFEEILEKVILNAEQKRRKQEEEKQQKLERDAASLRGAPAADTVSAMAGNGMKQ